MDNNKSDTLSQRKKAQEEFLKLKRMQQGELAPESVPEQIKPRTFSEKAANFWFHYKVHTIILIFLAITIIIGVTQCSKREHYDGRVVLYIDHVCSDAEADIYKEFLTPYFTDTDGDGRVNIQIINCAYTTEGHFDMEYTSALSSKLQAVISGDADVQLFIVDQTKMEQLNEIPNDLDSFFVETVEFPEEIYKLTKEQNFSSTDKIFLGRRVVGGTMIENAKDIEVYEKQAEEIMAKFR